MNRRRVKICHDKWLPRPISFKPISSTSLLLDNNFATCLDDVGMGNESFIRDHFLALDLDIICSIPLDDSSFED